jgi:hypothetical protein
VEQAIIVVSESQIMTIGGSNSNSKSKANPTGVSEARAQSTGSVQKFATYDPSAPAQVFNGTNQQILPAGIAAPSWSNAQSSVDPAIILEVNPSQAAFVEFQQEDKSQENSAAIVIVSS